MPKKLRHYRPHALVEITNRTVAGQYLLSKRPVDHLVC